MEKKELTSRQAQAIHTKKAIFDAAMSLLKTKNINDIKISDIVEKANVSAGSFYRYYKTKLNVYMDSYDEVNEYFETVVDPMMIQENAKDRIMTFFDQYVVYHTTIRDINFLRVLYSADNQILNKSDYAVEHDYGMLALLTRTVQYGIDKKQLKVSKEETALDVVSFLMILIRGIMFNWCTENGSYDLREKMRSYLGKLLQIY